MPLDTQETISRLQSASVRNSLILVVVNALTLFTVITGKALDIEAVKSALEMGIPLVINAASMWWGFRAYKGRVNAETKIEPLPWADELKTLTKKDPV